MYHNAYYLLFVIRNDDLKVKYMNILYKLKLK